MAASVKSSISSVMLLLMVTAGRSHDFQKDGHPPALKQNNNNKNAVISDDVSLQKASRICDDGKWNIQLDWDDKTSVDYQCQADEKQLIKTDKLKYKQECLLKKDIPRPIHICMNKKIEYLDTPPTAGPHRPQWPAYGEYRYLPPQRWVHSLEHGAAVFLYHPCAELSQIELLKKIARNCLKKHIITPYRKFSEGKLFAVITYGCRLQLNTVNELVVERFIQQHALQAPEGRVSRSGVYDYALLRSADIVSDENDSILCPKLDKENKNVAMMIAENMNDVGEETSSSYLY